MLKISYFMFISDTTENDCEHFKVFFILGFFFFLKKNKNKNKTYPGCFIANELEGIKNKMERLVIKLLN